METMDPAHQMTEKQLKQLEQRILRVYSEARDDLRETINDYFESFRKRDEEMKKLIGTIQNGKEWTEKDYKQWRLNQIGRGKRFEALKNKIAERMTKANETAIAYVNDQTPGVYSLNRNYAAYTIERVCGGVGFTLWDENTVRQIITNEPNLMPYYPNAKAVKRGIDLQWGKQQIIKSVTQGVLQGKSIGKIATDLQSRVSEMNRASAVRSARTAVTGAQNAGRMDSYHAAEKMGIKLKKEWLATLDARTRHSHAVVDGEVKDVDAKFSNGCRFPGDPQGKPVEIYNCRCTLTAAVDGVKEGNTLRRTRDGLIPDMTYAQWEASKRGYNGRQISPYNNETPVPTVRPSAKDVSTKYLETAKPKMGKVRYEKGYKQSGHKREIAVANQLRDLFGGKTLLLKESNAQGEKTPDYLWRGKLWELKSISTAKAADMAVRSAAKQIAKKPGGVVLQCAETIDTAELIRVIDDRAIRSAKSSKIDFDIIALSENGTFLFARRYKK